MARPMRILALFLLAQPILAQLTPPEPLAAAAAAHPARLFGAAAGQAHPRRLFGATQAGEAAPENHANARTVHASVSKFAHMLYDPAALAPPATPSQPHPAALSKEAVVAAAHAAALATLTRHSRSNPRHPFHAPRPFSPLFAGDACATLFVAVGVARTAGNTRAAALLLSKCQSACPIGYELDFTRRLCDVRPALRNTTFCAAAAAGDACQHGQRRLAGGWSDWDWPTWAKVTTVAVGAVAVVGAVAAAGVMAAAGTAAAAYEGGGVAMGSEDLYALQQALNANGLGVSYGAMSTLQYGVLVGGAII